MHRYSPHLLHTTFVYADATVLKKFSEGYSLGKLAVALCKDKSPHMLPNVIFIVTGMVNIWKEPMQVAIPAMFDSYNIALKVCDSNS